MNPFRCTMLIAGLCTLSLMGSSCNTYAQSRPVRQPATLSNPVLDKDFADPTVIRVGHKYYAYATQGTVNGKMWNIQVASSTDLQHWMLEGDALPGKPSWASGTQDFWAPHVLYDPQLKQYVLFYSAESDDTTRGKCLGVAFASKPGGPFIDKGSPLVCGDGFVNIDPMAFRDSGTGRKYLYWGSGFQPIRVQEMNKDWTGFKEGSAATDVVWPGREKNYDILVEGAWVDYHNKNYYLYYSGDNCCGDKAHYAVMVARASSATGPFQRLGEANGSGSSRILEKDSTWLAPGHNSIFSDEKGNIRIAYHAIDRGRMEEQKGRIRVFCILPLVYRNGWPQVNHPNQ